MRSSCVDVLGLGSGGGLTMVSRARVNSVAGSNLGHLQRERLRPSREGVAQIKIRTKQNDRRKRGHRPNGNLKAAARQGHRLAPPMRRQVLDRFGLSAANGFVQIAPDALRRAWAARSAIYSLEAETEASVHDLEHAQVHRRILLGAFKLLEETDAAHPFVEEANQHAVLRPDATVRGGQILHDVIGSGGERVFRRFDLIAGHAGRPSVDFELLDRLRDLVHELVWSRADQRRAQAPQHDEKRRGSSHQRARSHRHQVHRDVRRQRRRRHRRRLFRSNIEIVRRPWRHPVVPPALARSGWRRVRRGGWRGRIGDGRPRR